MDTEETPVIFRKYGPRRGGDVIALFPCEAGSTVDSYLCSSYVHVGQHGSADPWQVIQHTQRATPAEYANLKQELESEPYGYRLKVVAKQSREHILTRLRARE